MSGGRAQLRVEHDLPHALRRSARAVAAAAAAAADVAASAGAERFAVPAARRDLLLAPLDTKFRDARRALLESSARTVATAYPRSLAEFVGR